MDSILGQCCLLEHPLLEPGLNAPLARAHVEARLEDRTISRLQVRHGDTLRQFGEPRRCAQPGFLGSRLLGSDLGGDGRGFRRRDGGQLGLLLGLLLGRRRQDGLYAQARQLSGDTLSGGLAGPYSCMTKERRTYLLWFAVRTMPGPRATKWCSRRSSRGAGRAR